MISLCGKIILVFSHNPLIGPYWPQSYREALVEIVIAIIEASDWRQVNPTQQRIDVEKPKMYGVYPYKSTY